MGTTATTRPAGPAGTAGPGTRTGRLAAGLRRRPYLVDLGVAAAFLAAAAWLGHGLWPDPGTRELALNPHDQTLIEWFLAVDTRLLLGEHGLVSDRLNAPDGVNLLSNAAAPALGLLLAPVTLTLGAPVSFAVLTAGNLAATATAWYLLFARTLGTHRAAATAGGALCGFAPAMVSHANGHWHMTAQCLVPAMVWSVVRLARAAEADQPGRQLTSALWLAGLVVGQYFIGAEVLYLTAVTLVLVAGGYALARRDWARRVLPGFAAGLAVAAGAAAAVLAYPLYLQFAGPGSVPDGVFDPYYFSADLASWPSFAPFTIAGTGDAAALATGPAEYNTFLGWPLLLVAAGCVAWSWRRPLVRAAAGAAAVMALLSLGPELVVGGNRTDLPLPYRLLRDLPVAEGALPQRYAVAVVPLLATVLVVALDRAGHLRWPRVRWAVPVAVGLALLPLLPGPLPAGDREPVPAFISEGHWRGCTDTGGVLVPVPLPDPGDPAPMRWAAAANAGFALPEGFFIGPYGAGGRASMGTFPRPTSRLLAAVAESGEIPGIGPEHRGQARRDLGYWQAQCVVLGPGEEHGPALRRTLARLLGPGERVADAWVWRVRSAG